MKLMRIACLGLVAFAVACSSESPTTPNPGTPAAPDAGPSLPPTTAQPVTNELAVRTQMRALWEDHVFWTRNYIIDAVSGLPSEETATTAARLMKNQADIGNAIRPLYGDAAANQLTALLQQHISGAVLVIKAALAHDDVAFKQANDAWYANGYQIAQFLASANPNWPLDIVATHMKRHLDLTLAEASARISGDFAGEIRAYDAVVDHILTLSDFLTSGIVAQFPSKVGPSPMTPSDESLHVTMRKLWEAHVQWTRIYIVDQTANLPDTTFAANRLLQNQVDIGDAIKPFYGAAAGDQLAGLLKDHILGAVAVLEAVESNDANAITVANNAWYANANDIAQFLATANPNFPLADLQIHMKRHLDETLAEASAHLTGQWSADIEAYDAVVNHIRQLADILSDGIAKQFPQIIK